MSFRRNWLLTTIFCLIGIYFAWRLSPVLIQKDPTNNLIIRDYERSLTEPVDVYAVGSSHVRSISGARMLQKYGIHLYSIGTAGQPFLATTYLTDEIFKKNKPELLIINMSRLFVEGKSSFKHLVFDKDNNYIKKAKFLLNHYKFLDIKSSSLRDTFGLVFPFYVYHGRWSSISKKDIFGPEENRVCYYGAPVTNVCKPLSASYFILDDDIDAKSAEEIPVFEEELELFYNLIKKCKNLGVQVLLIQTPSRRWNEAKHLYVQKIAQENDLDFLDFNTRSLFEKCQFDAQNDFYDGNHLNIYGSLKITDYLGEFVSDNFRIDKDASTEYDKFTLDQFETAMKSIQIKDLTDIDDIFQIACLPGFDVLIQTNCEANDKWKGFKREWTSSTGLELNRLDNRIDNFLGIIQNGRLVYQDISSVAISYKGKFSDGKPFKIYSNVSRKAVPVMKIDGEKVYFSDFGLNILIYDSLNSMIVRTLTIDLIDGEWKII